MDENTQESITANEQGYESLKETARQESYALFVGFSTLAGAATFFTLIDAFSRISTVERGLLSLVVALIVVPKVFAQLREVDDPYFIQFAKAFRRGFMPLQALVAMVDWGGWLRRLWPW